MKHARPHRDPAEDNAANTGQPGPLPEPTRPIADDAASAAARAALASLLLGYDLGPSTALNAHHATAPDEPRGPSAGPGETVHAVSDPPPATPQVSLVEMRINGRTHHPERTAEPPLTSDRSGAHPRHAQATPHAAPDDSTDDTVEIHIIPRGGPAVHPGERRLRLAGDVQPAATRAPATAPIEGTSKAGRSCRSAAASTPPGERSCGTCSACCISLYIRSLAKPAGEPCSFLASPTGGGCTIHANRFPVCREFYCMWIRDRRGLLQESHRPDQLGLILTAGSPDEQGQQTIHAHEVWADAAERGEAAAVISFLRQFATVEVHSFRRRDAVRARLADDAARSAESVVINPDSRAFLRHMGSLVSRTREVRVPAHARGERPLNRAGADAGDPAAVTLPGGPAGSRPPGSHPELPIVQISVSGRARTGLAGVSRADRAPADREARANETAVSIEAHAERSI